MLNLSQYVVQVFEGGSSGHMSKLEDFPELTLKDLRQVIIDIFRGSDAVEFTEKLDGTNIQASMNNQGEVIFIRNKGDLNSERGGMSVKDMQEKWADKPKVQRAFVTAGTILEKVFQRIGAKFFNPDDETRRFANCECIIAGKTNIMPYADDSVDVHNIWVYKKKGDEWVKESVTRDGLDVIEKAIDKEDKAKLTPKVVIKISQLSNKYGDEICQDLNKMWKAEGLSDDDTLEKWEHVRFKKVAPEWMTDEDGAFFNRWFKMDKSVNMRVLKKNYPEHAGELSEIDKKDSKKYVSDVMEPIDKLFIKAGNYIISLIDGLQNGDPKNAKVIGQMKKDLEDCKEKVEKSDDMELKANFARHLQRIGDLSNINATEGIVMTWKGRMIKWTGSFAPLNQCLGIQYRIKDNS